MKLRIESVVPKPIFLRELPVGSFAEIADTSFNDNGAYIMRIDGGAVLLRDPSRCWATDTNMRVVPLPPGTTITLISEV